MTASLVCSNVAVIGKPRAVPARRNILWFLVLSYVVLLPYQFRVGTLFNFAPADCFLGLALLLGAGRLIYHSSVWSGWHLGVVLTFVTGSLISAMRHGTLASYELINKDFGLVLPFLSYLACTSIVMEWGDVRRISRVFVVTVGFENLIAIGAYLAG